MTEYFDSSLSILGSYHKCMICNKIPCEIMHDSSKLFTIWHCQQCKEEHYKPKNWFEKLLMWFDTLIN